MRGIFCDYHLLGGDAVKATLIVTSNLIEPLNFGPMAPQVEAAACDAKACRREALKRVADTTENQLLTIDAENEAATS